MEMNSSNSLLLKSWNTDFITGKTQKLCKNINSCIFCEVFKFWSVDLKMYV
jgi:hypothetical protein